MKKWILGAAAMLAVTAAPTMAAAQATGYVGLVYSEVEVDGSPDSDAWGVEGSVAWSNFEVDASIVDSDEFDTTAAIAGHLFSRTDRYLFGGFASFASADDTDSWAVGLEANKYFDRWTLFGALGYSEADNSSDVSATGVNIGASMFPTDNFRIDGNLIWASVENGADDDAFGYGIGFEWQMDAAPISLGVNYLHVELDDAGVEGDSLSLGVRYNWGGTLYDRDRSGASQANRIGIGSVLLL